MDQAFSDGTRAENKRLVARREFGFPDQAILTANSIILGLAAEIRDMKKRQPDPDSLTLVLLSDTHECHREIDVPPGDILVHAGDFTLFSRQLSAILDFNSWLGELPHRYKIVVPGNHEYFLEADQSRRALLSNSIVLIDKGVEVEGLRIWGSPATLYGGAFGMSSAKDRERRYARIPKSTDVLITHGPPYGILDSAPGTHVHSGCFELRKAVMHIRPRLHVFGHIHGSYGFSDTEHTAFANVSLAGRYGDMVSPPMVLKIASTGVKR